MTDPTHPTPSAARQTVVAVDGSAVSYEAVTWAAVDAAAHGSPLRIVTSIAVPDGFGVGAILTDSDADSLRREGDRIVAEARRLALMAAPDAEHSISTVVVFDPIVSLLVALSRVARMVVLGSHGAGAVRRGLLGSVAAAVIRRAHGPVAVVHSTAATDPVSAAQPVLVGVDGTLNSVPALELAFQEASVRKVGLTALHAWTDAAASHVLPGWEVIRETEDEAFARQLDRFADRYRDVALRRLLVRDRPDRALLAEAEHSQLLIVGSHGRGGFATALLGSTSVAVVHGAVCPVVVVRPT